MISQYLFSDKIGLQMNQGKINKVRSIDKKDVHFVLLFSSLSYQEITHVSAISWRTEVGKITLQVATRCR